MNAIGLMDVIGFIERDLPEWGWLLRNCRPTSRGGPYFANVTTPVFMTLYSASSGQSTVEGMAFKAHGNTPEEALMRAYTQAVEGEHKVPLKWRKRKS